jgi:DNA-directed RNA polymerase subunit RPC12/RpoP
MSSRVFISTECSQCGGIINLAEGTNAVKCPYCSSSFLITGYDKVLTYYISNNVEERRPAIQTLAHRHLLTYTDHYRIVDINLFFLPFYHLKGKIFQLVPDAQVDIPVSYPTSVSWSKIKTSYLNKSFLATTLEGLALYSLGIRTSVLRLKLFKSGTLAAKGKVYQVDFGIDKAMEIGLGKTQDNGSYARVISKMLSVVYAPVWEVNVKGIERTFSIIIDGLGETITDDNAPFQFLTENLKEESSKTFPTISFHALKCPNCGWDIPADPSLYVFVCDNCRWVWECATDGFREVSGTIAQPHPESELPELTYLPFWVFPARTETKHHLPKGSKMTRLFIPAFKVRDLSVIYRLATIFTKVQPELDLTSLAGDYSSSRIEGAVMRWKDARELSDLFVGNRTEKTGISLERESTRQLIWFPFYERGLYLRDAILNAGIQKAKIRSPKLLTLHS